MTLTVHTDEQCYVPFEGQPCSGIVSNFDMTCAPKHFSHSCCVHDRFGYSGLTGKFIIMEVLLTIFGFCPPFYNILWSHNTIIVDLNFDGRRALILPTKSKSHYQILEGPNSQCRCHCTSTYPINSTWPTDFCVICRRLLLLLPEGEIIDKNKSYRPECTYMPCTNSLLTDDSTKVLVLPILKSANQRRQYRSHHFTPSQGVSFQQACT